MRKLWSAAAAAAIAATALAGDISITTLVVEGDDVLGIGSPTFINSVAVNDNGQWIMELDTNHADTTQDVIGVTGITPGVYTLKYREGQPLASPPGATLSSVGALNFNNSGNFGENFFLDGTAGTNDDSGIYFNLDLVFQEGTISSVLPNPTPYIGFFSPKFNNANQILIPASVDIPGIGTTVDRVLVRIDNPGGAFTENILVKEMDEILPGRFLTEIETSTHESALNDNGDAMYAVDVDGATTDDILIFINSTLIAQEGQASPVAGRLFSSLSSPEVDLNNSGDYVFTGTLDGDTASASIIIKNGAKFVQEGDNIKAIPAGTAFTSFGSGPVLLDDDGDVLWYGDWSDANTDIDTGLFLNDQLLIQEGVTVVDIGDPNSPNPVVVDGLRGISEGYNMSDSGEYIIARVTFPGPIDGTVLIHIPIPDCTGDLNGDGAVNITDLGILLANFGIPSGATPEQGDLNGDGAVNVSDLGLMLNGFGAGCP